MFDITYQPSFNDIKLHIVKQGLSTLMCKRRPAIVLIGIKLDNESPRQVSKKEIEVIICILFYLK